MKLRLNIINRKTMEEKNLSIYCNNDLFQGMLAHFIDNQNLEDALAD